MGETEAQRKSVTPSHTVSGARAMIEPRQTDTKPGSYPALVCGTMSGEASSSSDTPTGLQGEEEVARSGEAEGRWEEKCGNRPLRTNTLCAGRRAERWEGSSEGESAWGKGGKVAERRLG